MKYYTLGLGFNGTDNFYLATQLAKLYSRKLGYKVYVVGVRNGYTEGILID